MKKRSISLLLVLILTVSLLSGFAVGASATDASYSANDIWTVNVYAGGTTVTVDRMEKAYTSSIAGISVGGTDYPVSSAGATKTDGFGNVWEATFTLSEPATADGVSILESNELLTIVVDGVSASYSRSDLAKYITTGSLAYGGTTSNDDSTTDSYYGIATEYITMSDLLRLAGVSGYESISFRPIDWNDSNAYVRTFTDVSGMVLALKSYQSGEQSNVTADKADTLNAFRLIRTGTSGTGFESVKWVNYISIISAPESTTGGGSGGAAAPVVTPAPAAEKVEPKVTVTDGAAVVTVEPEKLVSAAEGAGKNTQLVIEADTESASKVTLTLPKETVAAVGSGTAGLVIETGIGDIVIPAAALTGLGEKSGEEIGITAEVELDGSVKLTITSGSEVVGSVSGGVKLAFRVPDALNVPLAAAPSLANGTVNPNLVAVLVDGESETVIKKSVVADGYVYVMMDGSGTVKVVNNAKTFGDVASGAWYFTSVSFAASHGLFSGMTDTTFEPNAEMTRAMLVTVLHRLESMPKSSKAGDFTDVTSGAWYTDAVLWASENDIVGGYGNGLFGTNDSVTRQQVAAILFRYAKSIGLDVIARGDLSAYTDKGEIADWASDAMAWAVASGIMSGKSAATLDPAGTATRAEVATMLQSFIKLILK